MTHFPAHPSSTRRTFLRSGALAAAGAAMAASPARIFAQAPDPLAAMRAPALTTPITTTKLYDNLFLLQGAGGNMAAQIGPDGKILIDSSYLTAAPRILDALKALSADPLDALINTHWHVDHADGNQAMHQAGFTIFAHSKTRERLSTPQSVKLLGISLPAYPAAAWPVVTFDDSLHAFHNGDQLDLVHFAPAHTDTDIYIHFHNANVLHLGDIWFNGFYPFIDEGTGGTIDGMIRAAEVALAVADANTKIIPGHGPLGSKAEVRKFHDMLAAVRDKVAALKTSGASEQEALAKKPTADFDAANGVGMMSPDQFAGLVYRTL